MAWMAWTWPTATFFVVIILLLASMTAAELLHPTTLRKGWLPIATTRGDRLFIGLLALAFAHIGWLAVTDLPLWWMTCCGVAGVLTLIRWG